MNDQEKTREQLIDELKELRQKPEALITAYQKDITEYQLVEDKLRSSEERWKIMFDYAPDAYYLSDLKGNFIDGNFAAEKFLGFDKNELIGKSFLKLNLLSPKYLLVAAKLLTKNLSGQSTGPDELVINRKDGSKIMAEISTHPVKIKGRTVVLGIARDITERKRAKETLQESEKNLQEKVNELSLLYNASSSLLESDNTDYIYNFLGEKAYQLSGADYMLITEYNEQNKSTSIRQVFGVQSYVEKLVKIVGIDLSQIQVPIKDLTDQKNLTLKRKIYHVEGGLYALTKQKIPQVVCKSIEKLLGIEKIFSIGFIWTGNYYGGVTWGFKKGNQFKNWDLIESVVNQAALALNRKLAEHALSESEQRYQTLARISPVGIFRTDATGTTTYVNPKYCQITGLSAAEAFGDSWLRAVHPEDREKLNTNWMASTQKHAALSAEYRFVHPDGSITWVFGQAVEEKNDKGKIVGYVGTITDISERKRAENNLKLFRTLIDGTNDSIEVLDPETGRFLDVNERGYLDLGYSREEFLALSVFDVDTQIDQSLYKKIVEELRTSSHTIWESIHRRKDGSTFPVEMNIKIVRVDRDYTVSVVRDITERKQAEEELIKAKEKAEESDRLKSAFLANMSHEIRTPMNGILGFAELLKEPDLTGEERNKYISIIEKGGIRLLNIINNIISVSKVESGQMEVIISETNVNEQIEYLCTFFKPEAEQKGFQIFFTNKLPAKEAIIKTDREKVYAILTNLVKNAIKFTHQGFIEIGCEEKGKYLEFFVKDTGVGIRQEQKKFIFERFRQVSESLNRIYEGAGLGLSISKAYVEMLGGKIWVESEEGKGSVFYFTIPCNTESEEKNVINNVVSADGKENQIKNLKILIAEDDETSEILLTTAVKKLSKEVLKVRIGVETVEVCRNNPDIDLVLMDIRMPVMDGYEAARLIRQFNKDVVIIAQTAYGLTGDREKAIEAGCNDYISKPISKALLTELIKKYFK